MLKVVAFLYRKKIVFTTLIATFQFGLTVQAQTVRIAVDNADLIMLFKEIHKQTGYNFLFDAEQMKLGKQLSVNFKDLPVEKALNQIFKDQPLTYTLKKRTVIVKLNKDYELKKSFIIKGIVTDIDGLPVPNVTVNAKKNKQITMTNSEGIFSITSGSDTEVLQFNCVGYALFEYNYSGEKTVVVTMQEEQRELEDVVVIGYQEVSKRKTTAAITHVKMSSLGSMPATSFDNMLQGRVTGVNIQQLSGDPGTKGIFNIRGNTTITANDIDGFSPLAISNPLFIIDGIPISNDELDQMYKSGTGTNFLSFLNPNDIATVDVLKDASATAIYGSRGANGVVMITTKKGEFGPTRISFNNYIGVTQITKLRETLAGVTERRMKMHYINLFGSDENLKTLPMMLTDSLNEAFNNHTDWQSIFYQNGLTHNSNLSVSGATQKINYRVSAGYLLEKGILKNTGIERYAVTANLGFKLFDRLEVENLNLRFSHIDRERGNGESPGLAVNLSSNMPSSFWELTDAETEILTGFYDLRKDQNATNNFTLATVLSYRISSELSLRSQLSAYYTTDKRNISIPGALNVNNVPSSSNYVGISQTYDVNNYLQYSKEIKGIHNLVFIAGQRINYYQSDETYAGNHLNTDEKGNTDLASTQNVWKGSTQYGAYGILSYFSRLNYEFKNKYLLQLNWSADAASKFGSKNQWGNFYSISGGWILSDEKFMKRLLPWAEFVKLRSSFGVTGEQIAGRPYLKYSVYDANTGQYSGSDANTYNGVKAITPDFYNGLAQNKLTWQEAKQWNIGLDLEMLKGSVSANVDVYSRTTEGIPFNISLPVTNGYDVAYTNSIGINNSGIELQLNLRNINKDNFKWRSTFNISHNLNIITKLPYEGRDLVTSSGRLLTRGMPAYQFYLLRYLGVYDSVSEVPVNPFTGLRYSNLGTKYGPGYPIIQDVDHDYKSLGAISDYPNNRDLQPLGDPNPKATGGLNNQFTYKRVSLSVFCTYTLGRTIINTSAVERFFNINQGIPAENLATIYLPDTQKMGFWEGPGTGAKYPALNPFARGYPMNGDQSIFLEDGSYFKVKNVSLSYDFNGAAIRALKINRFRVYVTLDNIWTFQKSQTIPNVEQVDAYGRYIGSSYPISNMLIMGAVIDL